MTQRSVPAISLTVGASEHPYNVGLTKKDVWHLRNGYMVLRDGVLVIPQGEKLHFLRAAPALQMDQRLLTVMDAAILTNSVNA